MHVKQLFMSERSMSPRFELLARIFKNANPSVIRICGRVSKKSTRSGRAGTYRVY